VGADFPSHIPLNQEPPSGFQLASNHDFVNSIYDNLGIRILGFCMSNLSLLCVPCVNLSSLSMKDEEVCELHM